MKKTLSLLLVLLLMMGMSTIAFADESKSASINNVSIEEYNELISDMFKAAANVKIKGDTTIYIPVQSGKFNGVVIIKDEPVFEQQSQVVRGGSEIFDGIPDGNRRITTTLKADPILGGEMVLKSYYTMKNNGTAIDVTSTNESFSPPLGYTNAGTSSYIAVDRSDYFKTKGSYTMKAADLIPITKRAVHEVELWGAGVILLTYYAE
ncbi:MAG: hypothetical protein NUK57_04785 [Gudongella sp.]|nr:hypothetical protein [Gudongella sp.]